MVEGFGGVRVLGAYGQKCFGFGGFGLVVHGFGWWDQGLVWGLLCSGLPKSISRRSH